MNTHDLIATIGRVAAHYAVGPQYVTVEFTWSPERDATYTITVKSPALDRRKRDDCTTASGDSLAEAERVCFARSKYHDL